MTQVLENDVDNRPAFYDAIRTHCESGIRRSSISGRLLVGCGNVELVVEIISHAAQDIADLRLHIESGEYTFDGLIADVTILKTMLGFDRDEAWCIVKKAGSAGLQERHLAEIERDYHTPFLLLGGDPLTRETRGIERLVVHRAKVVLFMEAYTFLAERLLDENGKLKK